MKQWIFKTSLALFLLTFIPYVLTLFYASYVGVKLMYIAVPVIAISGFIAFLSRPNDLIEKIERL